MGFRRKKRKKDPLSFQERKEITKKIQDLQRRFSPNSRRSNGTYSTGEITEKLYSLLTKAKRSKAYLGKMHDEIIDYKGPNSKLSETESALYRAADKLAHALDLDFTRKDDRNSEGLLVLLEDIRHEIIKMQFAVHAKNQDQNGKGLSYERSRKNWQNHPHYKTDNS